MFIDTHCHINDGKYTSVDDVVNAYLSDNVSTVINMGCELNSSIDSKNLAEKYPSIYFACGVHPSDVDKVKDGDFDKIKAIALHEKCVAIGEIGLDYYWPGYDKNKQIETFIYQLDLAYELKLPVSIHCRDATFDTLNILKERKAKLAYGAVMHCYSGSVETARDLLNMGVYIAFGGTLTFKNARKAVEVASYVPNDFCLTETDSPFLAPHPYRGTINEPKYVKVVTEFLAGIKNLETEKFADIVMQNAKRLFYKIKK